MIKLLFIIMSFGILFMVCSMQKNSKFGFELYDGYVIINVRLNNGVEGRCLLDTGSDVTVIDRETAERLKLEIIGYHEGGVAGGKKIRVPLSSIESISIGQYSTSLSPIAIADVNQGEEPYGEIIGIIGSDFLKNFAITINYKEKVLIFEDAASLTERIKSGVKIPLDLVENTAPYLEVTINDSVKAKYKLDSGAGITFLRLKDLYSAGISENTTGVEKTTSKSVAGDYSTLQTRLASFSAGEGLEVKDLLVKAYESEIGFIGANYLSNFVITLNYEDRYAVFKQN